MNEYTQKQRAAMMEESRSMIGNYGATQQTLSSPSINLKSSPVDADLDAMERELNILIDNLGILRQRLNPVLCPGFEFIPMPEEPIRQGSPLSHRLNVFRSCIGEAINRVDTIKNGLEI